MVQQKFVFFFDISFFLRNKNSPCYRRQLYLALPIIYDSMMSLNYLKSFLFSSLQRIFFPEATGPQASLKFYSKAESYSESLGYQQQVIFHSKRSRCSPIRNVFWRTSESLQSRGKSIKGEMKVVWWLVSLTVACQSVMPNSIH